MTKLIQGQLIVCEHAGTLEGIVECEGCTAQKPFRGSEDQSRQVGHHEQLHRELIEKHLHGDKGWKRLEKHRLDAELRRVQSHM
jgi:hypothetical protein